MEQYKKAHKKVGKKNSKKTSKKLTMNEVVGRWMVSTNNDLFDTMIDLDDLRTSVGRMHVAISALVIFSVVMAVSFLLVLFSNQYLIK